MKASDIIEQFINDLISDTGNIAEIQRNELALKFNCVPSQINYVISTRFTTEKGYIVESKRGGGGYIRIQKIEMDNGQRLMHVINGIGDKIDESSAEAFIKNLFDYGIASLREGAIMLSAVNDRSIGAANIDKDIIRANILKNMLIKLVAYK